MTFLVSTLQTTPLFLTHCTVAQNTGGGVSGGRLVSCVITGNYCSYNFEGGENGPGGVSSCVISNCLIAGNIGTGVKNSDVYNCRVEGNTSKSFAGGVQTAGGLGSFRVRNSIIVNNSNTNRGAAGGGIQVSGEASCVIENCLIAGNYSAYQCGGVYHGSVYNCTIVSNTAAARYGGIEPHLLYNSIVYYNSAPTNRDTVIRDFGYVAFNCTTTNADDAAGAFGNITNEPRFVNAAGGNFRLAASSPCINQGSNGYVTASYDLDGLPRIYNGTVDMGAYEFQGAGYVDTDMDGMPDDWESDHGLNPAVSNAAGANADGDWMTDFEEYAADTHPNDIHSFLPDLALASSPPGVMAIIIDPTSTARVYGIRRSTNLLDNPQVWTLFPPEKTGTGSAVQFTVTNDVLMRVFRSSVRLP
ncbi:MAG: hypothetical protein BWY59_01026 [Verrucomicrobia bacterium ADurb.Bin345]|nr:MAG: hypothetical protein BWY59_01026 [Verrucomicrobia bacterium ADurb.Bin345]